MSTFEELFNSDNNQCLIRTINEAFNQFPIDITSIQLITKFNFRRNTLKSCLYLGIKLIFKTKCKPIDDLLNKLNEIQIDVI